MQKTGRRAYLGEVTEPGALDELIGENFEAQCFTSRVLPVPGGPRTVTQSRWEVTSSVRRASVDSAEEVVFFSSNIGGELLRSTVEGRLNGFPDGTKL